MAWITRWELDRFLRIDRDHRAAVKRIRELETLIANKESEAKQITAPKNVSVDLMAMMGGHLPSRDPASRPPVGIERLVPGVDKYLIEGWHGRRWATEEIERDLDHLDTYDSYQAGKALHNQLEKEEPF